MQATGGSAVLKVTMTLGHQFAIALAVNFAVVVLMFPVLQWAGRARFAALVLPGLLSAASPCAIGPEHTSVRLIAVLITSGVLVKVYDLGCEAAAGRVPTLWTYIA